MSMSSMTRTFTQKRPMMKQNPSESNPRARFRVYSMIRETQNFRFPSIKKIRRGAPICTSLKMVSREGTKRTSVKIYGAQIVQTFRAIMSRARSNSGSCEVALELLLFVRSAYGAETCESQYEPPIGCICYTMGTGNREEGTTTEFQ